MRLVPRKANPPPGDLVLKLISHAPGDTKSKSPAGGFGPEVNLACAWCREKQIPAGDLVLKLFLHAPGATKSRSPAGDLVLR